MSMTAPWRDRDRITSWLAGWRASVLGRDVHGLSAGRGWVSLQLTGKDRPSLFLGALPGAVLLFPFQAPLPTVLRSALLATRRHPLAGLLPDARLSGAALLAADLVLQLTFSTSAGPRFLRHQLFGSRGGMVMLTAEGRLLWTAYPSPHPCLLDICAALVDPALPAETGEPTMQSADSSEAWALAGQQRLARQLEVSLGDRLQQAVSRQLAAVDRLIENLSADLAHADSGRQLREDAETLAAHLHTVQRGVATVTCPSPHDGNDRTIVLDPTLSASANLERLFHQARKAQRGRQIIASRLMAARMQQVALQDAAAELASCLHGPHPPTTDQRDWILARLGCLQTLAERLRPLLHDKRTGSASLAPDEPALPFRRYMINGRWEVWIGRNNHENDTLTHRVSHPRDLWLHAQSVEGSHVVLRTGGRPTTVPLSVIEQAAGLAAFFSKARHSSLVPVIWTERRYVRRPRGAAPGTAVCLRAKNLFVTPGVATGVEPV